MAITAPAPVAYELESLATLLPEEAVREAVPLLASLAADADFLESSILPLLKQPQRTEGWYVAGRRGGQEDSCSVQVFVWPAGSRTRIHDHSCWGAFSCVARSLLEERYERLDDGSEPYHARLRLAWRRMWGVGDGVSTVLPYEGGIHRVTNPGQQTAISVHLYGPMVGEVDGRDYDPSQNYVCNRSRPEHV